MMATKTSRRLASLSKTFFVSVGITARSGCLQIGVSVPKMPKRTSLREMIKDFMCASIFQEPSFIYHHSLKEVLILLGLQHKVKGMN